MNFCASAISLRCTRHLKLPDQLPHQSLVGAKDDRPHNSFASPPAQMDRNGSPLAETDAQAEFHGTFVVGQRTHGGFVLTDAGSGHGHGGNGPRCGVGDAFLQSGEFSSLVG